MSDFNEKYNKFLENTKSALSSWMYYLFALAVIVVMVFIQLGVFEFKQETNFFDFLEDTVPIFIASMLLSNIFYQNGVAKGKKNQNYFLAISEFSSLANFPGEKLDKLPQFCDEYNALAVKRKQETYLAMAVVSYDKFENEYKDGENDENDEKKHVPIKVMSDKSIIEEFGKERGKWIIKAKKVKLKGVNVVSLTSEQKVSDITDTGYGEGEYAKMFTTSKVLSYAISFVLFSFITAKDIMAWGWAGLGLLLFKITYTLGCSILGQSRGYRDITVNVVAHYNRKTDIIKQFHSWYEKKHLGAI